MKFGPHIDKIALVGTFGCGKTTVIDAIKDRLGDTQASVQIIEEYPKKLFVSEPYVQLPTEEWPEAWFREVQEKTIHGVLEEEQHEYPKKKLTIMESYWANILPYTIKNFGEAHTLTRLVRARLQDTIKSTIYVYLEHVGIPLDTKNRHADLDFRNQVAEQIQAILYNNDANIIPLGVDKDERSVFVEELCKGIG